MESSGGMHSRIADALITPRQFCRVGLNRRTGTGDTMSFSDFSELSTPQATGNSATMKNGVETIAVPGHRCLSSNAASSSRRRRR